MTHPVSVGGSRRTLLLAGCACVLLASANRTPAAEASRPLVFAAASLKNAFDAIDARWQAVAGKRALISYAASSALAKQIDAGAPADVFVSADLDWMDWCEQRRLIRPESRVRVARNRLVLIAPRASTVRVELGRAADLVGALGPDGRLALAETTSVPAGRYAKSALESLGLWSSVSDRLAQAENVRAALLLVSRGEAPLGIVYATDAAADRNVRIVGTFAAGTHPEIVYPAALTARTSNVDAAAFVAFLSDPQALAILAAEGFDTAR